MIVFDIETSPLAQDVVLQFCPDFQPPPHPGEFVESDVRVGNTKDPEKVAAKIAEARVAHEKAVTDYATSVQVAMVAHAQAAMDVAALSALTARVLAIGYQSLESGKMFIRHGDDEPEMLKEFWRKYEECRAKRRKMVGHNIHDFDVPFLARRSRVHRIPVPATVLEKQKWLDTVTFWDTLKLWACGGREYIGLDALDRALGGLGKPKGITGDMFHKLYYASDTDRVKALDYLKNDLEMTLRVAVAFDLT